MLDNGVGKGYNTIVCFVVGGNAFREGQPFESINKQQVIYLYKLPICKQGFAKLHKWCNRAVHVLLR